MFRRSGASITWTQPGNVSAPGHESSSFPLMDFIRRCCGSTQMTPSGFNDLMKDIARSKPAVKSAGKIYDYILHNFLFHHFIYGEVLLSNSHAIGMYVVDGDR